MRMGGALVSLLVALAALSCGCSGGDDGGAVITLGSSGTAAARAAAGTPTVATTVIPPPDVLVSTSTATQASAILVSVMGEVSGGSITFINRTYKLTQGSQSMYAFIGVDADDPPGAYPAKIDFVLKNGSKGSTSTTITVAATKWTQDSVTVPPNLALLLDPAVTAAELAQLKQVYGGYTPQKLWSGPWLVPAKGAITTHFGEQRSYNGGPITGHHGGTDIGAGMGDPVTATNSGRVVMARQLRVHGNMIVIDHGGGVYSSYAHLGSFAVAEGQEVKGGDLVGYVGTSGLSTGAHLHWEISVGGVLVDALRFTDGSDGF